MKIGTKSILFGAHQFLLHPLFVALAWWQLYGFPWDPRLWVAFFVHDLGYWGKPNMDGPEGEEHPLLGAAIMGRLFDRGTEVCAIAADELEISANSLRDSYTVDGAWQIRDDLDHLAFEQFEDLRWMIDGLRALTHWHDFTLYHSRFMARRHCAQFSRLCVADKLATVLMPAWLYLLLVNLTGEIREYMDIASHKEGGKYGHEARALGTQRQWRDSMCDYMRGWIAEHRDGRADTWTPEVTA